MKSSILEISNLPKKTNKSSSEILLKAQKTCADLGLIFPHFEDYETMTCYLYPDGGKNKVTDTAVFFDILYFVDDYFGEDTKENREMPNLKKLTALLLGENLVPNDEDSNLAKLYIGIHELNKLINKFSPEQKEIILDTLFEHLKDTFSPKEYRSVNEYISTRLKFSGMLLSIDMLNYVYGDNFYILLENLKVKEVRNLCGEIGALSNDIFSYPKEKESKFNLINVIIHLNLGSNEYEAISMAIKIVNNKYYQLLDLINEIKSDNNGSLEKESILVHSYLDRILDIVSASYHWQISTNRYKTPFHFFEDMK